MCVCIQYTKRLYPYGNGDLIQIAMLAAHRPLGGADDLAHRSTHVDHQLAKALTSPSMVLKWKQADMVLLDTKKVSDASSTSRLDSMDQEGRVTVRTEKRSSPFLE